MFIEINEFTKVTYTQLKKVLTHYGEISKIKLSNDPCDHYRVDRCDARRYFGIMPKWKEKILKYLRNLRDKEEKIAYIDICGRASGQSLGCDLSFLFSLKTDKFRQAFSNKGDVYIDGDIFNPSDFSKLLRIVEREGIAPAFITFMPMAGLHHYTPGLKGVKEIPQYEAITYSYLGEKLKRLIAILRPGGYVLIERPFQLDGSVAEFMHGTPQQKFQLSLIIKKFARKLKCRVEIFSGLGGPYFLIHKPIST